MNKVITWIIVALILLNSTIATSIILESPLNKSFFNTNTITFVYTLNSSKNITNCTLIINKDIRLVDTSIEQNSQNTFSIGLNQGSYNWSINCSYVNGSITSEKRIFWIDTETPEITISNPIIGRIYSGQIDVIHSEQDSNLDKCYYRLNAGQWQNITCKD